MNKISKSSKKEKIENSILQVKDSMNRLQAAIDNKNTFSTKNIYLNNTQNVINDSMSINSKFSGYNPGKNITLNNYLDNSKKLNYKAKITNKPNKIVLNNSNIIEPKHNINNFKNYNLPNNGTNLNYNINNPQIYIPTKLRNKEQNSNNMQGDKNQQLNMYQNQKKDDITNTKNKFDKKSAQFTKKEGKNKKHFEVRAGDWTCSKCNNLNFSFRNKCNRCGLPKELNAKFDQMNPEMFNQNQNYQLMNGINPNFLYTNNINNVNININNVNNPNNIKYYPK